MSEIVRYLNAQSLRLEEVGIDCAKSEMEWILSHVLELDRVGLFMHGDSLLTDEKKRRVEEIVARRITRYPLQFILNEAFFYGRKYYVNEHVMAPTPETERLCETALGFLSLRKLESPQVLDVGVGSGVIALTMAAECESARVTALDVSAEALEVARRNAEELDVTERVTFRESNFFSALDSNERFDLILSNPPYIREVDYAGLDPEVMADPKIAMTSGDDGLDAIRVIVREAPRFLKPDGRIMFEIGYGQAELVAELTERDSRYTAFHCVKDLNDIDRIVILKCEE